VFTGKVVKAEQPDRPVPFVGGMLFDGYEAEPRVSCASALAPLIQRAHIRTTRLMVYLLLSLH
jgi:hypothetical protein